MAWGKRYSTELGRMRLEIAELLPANDLYFVYEKGEYVCVYDNLPMVEVRVCGLLEPTVYRANTTSHTSERIL